MITMTARFMTDPHQMRAMAGRFDVHAQTAEGHRIPNPTKGDSEDTDARSNVPEWTRLVGVAIGLSAMLVGLVTLTGCGNAPHPGAGTVVASTDVWGSVASAVADGHVTVKSIVTSAVADPHTYEVTPVDDAAIADAAVVVYNGGGYDPWVDRVLTGHPAIESVNAYSLLPPAPGGSGGRANEHVFYNLDVAKSVAAKIADKLATIDPHNAGDYRANAAKFGRNVDAIADSEHAIATAHPRARVIATEPVAYYPLAASGLINQAPASFTAATENDEDPSPADMAYVLDLIDNRQVSALLINPQTDTAATKELQTAARRVGVPVTEVTETLPTGTDYLTWQRNTVNSLAAALGQADSHGL
jgi:zinc/manganese transport system substrate-binding protein